MKEIIEKLLTLQTKSELTHRVLSRVLNATIAAHYEEFNENLRLVTAKIASEADIDKDWALSKILDEVNEPPFESSDASKQRIEETLMIWKRIATEVYNERKWTPEKAQKAIQDFQEYLKYDAYPPEARGRIP